MRTPGRLRRRLLAAFATIVAASVLLYGLAALALMYAVEDAFFDAQLADERARQVAHAHTHGTWTQPAAAHIAVVSARDALPPEVDAVLREEPGRVEFALADGRHLHLAVLPATAGAPQAWLLAEVSDQLVVRPNRGTVLTVLALCGLLLGAGGLALGAWIARRTAAPMDALARALADGDAAGLPRAMPTFRDDGEVGAVRDALAAMVERTRRFIEREQAFTRDASHELRTPLAVIRAQAEGLLARVDDARPGSDAGAHRESLAFILAGTLSLERTVAALLALARESPGPVETPPTRVRPVLEQVVLEQSAALQGRDIAIEVELADDWTLPRSAMALHLLLSPLVGNAFMHTLAGSVHIGSEGECLMVRNTVDADATAGPRERVLPPRHDSPGLGLGLGLLERLCARYRMRLVFTREADEVVARLRVEDGA
jgi:signal transduction histidine kinase